MRGLVVKRSISIHNLRVEVADVELEEAVGIAAHDRVVAERVVDWESGG